MVHANPLQPVQLTHHPDALAKRVRVPVLHVCLDASPADRGDQHPDLFALPLPLLGHPSHRRRSDQQIHAARPDGFLRNRNKLRQVLQGSLLPLQVIVHREEQMQHLDGRCDV